MTDTPLRQNPPRENLQTAPRTEPLSSALPEHVAWSDVPDGLQRIQRPEVTLAVWARELPSTLIPALQDAALDELPEIDLQGHVERVAEDAHAAIITARLPDWPARAWLAADVRRLARRYATVTGAQALHLRLTPSDRDMCRYFHVDAFDTRLLCTYLGPATQWIAEADVEGTELGAAGTERILQQPWRIRQLPTGTVGLIKGRSGARAGKALVHRSPPIEQSGVRRLLLKIDPAGLVRD